MGDTGRSMLRLLHYWWPLAVGWSLMVVVRRATGRTAHPAGVASLLCGIVAAYSLDRVLDPAAHRPQRWMLRLLAATGVLAALACGVAALRLPIRTAALIPALGAAALLYPRLKSLTLTKTVALPLAWTWAVIALPFNDGSWLGWHTLANPVAPSLLLLVASGCLLCDLKDEAVDRTAGVRSVPARLGGDAALRIAALGIITSLGTRGAGFVADLQALREDPEWLPQRDQLLAHLELFAAPEPTLAETVRSNHLEEPVFSDGSHQK